MSLHSLGRLGHQLETVPALDVLGKCGVDQSVLLDHGNSLELVGHNLDGEHGSAAAANVLDVQTHGLELVCQFLADLSLVVVELVGTLPRGVSGHKRRGEASGGQFLQSGELSQHFVCGFGGGRW